MSPEWQPGDVAVLHPPGIPTGIVGLRVESNEFCPGHQRGQHWHTVSGDYLGTMGDGVARPLVVIDPEDREQAHRLIDLYFLGGADVFNAERMQAALREFANPTPTVEEPTNLFSVVEDRGGDQWCHVGEGVWRSLTSTGQFMVEKHWHDNSTPLAGNVVKVLSEGVTA